MPIILRDAPDIKWRLLEHIISYEREDRTAEKREIILLVASGTEDLLSLVVSLARAFDVQISVAVTQVSRKDVREGVKRDSAPIRNENVQKHFASKGKDGRRDCFLNNDLSWSLRARQDFAYVRQFGRFPGDMEFWRTRITQPASVALSTGTDRIRFRLFTQGDFSAFESAVTAMKTSHRNGSTHRPVAEMPVTGERPRPQVLATLASGMRHQAFTTREPLF